MGTALKTAWMGRLIRIFVVIIWHKQISREKAHFTIDPQNRSGYFLCTCTTSSPFFLSDQLAGFQLLGMYLQAEWKTV